MGQKPRVFPRLKPSGLSTNANATVKHVRVSVPRGFRPMRKCNHAISSEINFLVHEDFPRRRDVRLSPRSEFGVFLIVFDGRVKGDEIVLLGRVDQAFDQDIFSTTFEGGMLVFVTLDGGARHHNVAGAKVQ